MKFLEPEKFPINSPLNSNSFFPRGPTKAQPPTSPGTRKGMSKTLPDIKLPEA